jgi:hypothetical protein
MPAAARDASRTPGYDGSGPRRARGGGSHKKEDGGIYSFYVARVAVP